MMISVDIGPNLSAICGSEVAAAVFARSALPATAQQPSADAVAAFQSAMGSLVAENREVQTALEKIVPLPLEVPSSSTPVAETVQCKVASEAKPAVAQEAKPTVAPEVRPAVALVTPEIVREFAEVIAPLVAENREVQTALEKIVPLPLEVPAATAEAKVAVTPAAKPVAEVEAQPVVAPESKPEVAQVTPKIVREFAEVIAPLVAENREVQAALENVVARPLVVPARDGSEGETVVAPVAKPVAEVEAKPVVASAAKPAVATTEAKRAVVVEDKISEAGLPDAGVVMQAAPVAPQRQIDATARPESARVAVDGVSSAVASRRTVPTPSEVLIAAAEAVADTIMVTPGLLSGEGQIRVQLRPDVLEGTEIQLNVAGKTISVQFLPQTTDMAALIQRCLPQLEQHLATRIHSFTIAATVGTVRRRKA